MKKLPVLFTPILALSFALSPVSPDHGSGSFLVAPQAQASQIKVVVNDEVVTSYAIARRVAFLRLQRKSGGLQNQALEELTEEALEAGCHPQGRISHTRKSGQFRLCQLCP